MENFQINFTMTGFKERNIILENPTLGKIEWPIKKFPDEIKIGDQVSIGIITKNFLSKENQIKEALNNLIN